MNLPIKPTRFRGVRIHDPKGPPANAIGAQTGSQIDKSAAEEAKLTQPISGGDMPQDELRRFGS